MAANNILTCNPGLEGTGTITVSTEGFPICDGSWELDGSSTFWNLALSGAELSQLIGQIAMLFALAWMFKFVLSFILNKR